MPEIRSDVLAQCSAISQPVNDYEKAYEMLFIFTRLMHQVSLNYDTKR